MSICKALWDGFVVHWSGAVFPCCMICDLACRESLRLGSLKETSLTEIYHSDRLRSMRRRFASGDPKGLCCSHCGQGELCCGYMDETAESLRSLDEASLQRLYPVGRLEVSLTDHCNMLCLMCAKRYGEENPPGLGRSGFIDTAMLRRAMEEFRGLSAGPGVLFCHWVGEPTLHPDLAEILRFADGLGLRIALVTNGIRFPAELSDLLVSLQNSYLVSFSLNAAREETYRIVNDSVQQPRVLANIEAFLERRARAGRVLDLAVAVTMVVLKENVEEAVLFRDTWFEAFRRHGGAPCLSFNGRGANTASQVNILREAGRLENSEELFFRARAALTGEAPPARSPDEPPRIEESPPAGAAG